MNDGYISREEHEEFCKRIDAENHRQNRRIELLEQNTKQISALTTSVEKLALSIESMVKEQEAQGKRLKVLESRDGKMWREAVKYMILTIIGIMIGYIFTQLGF